MDHTITTRWGGRQGRYAEFRGAVGRCFDPFGTHPVEFEKPIEYEAWIRYRFDPDTGSITHKKSSISAVLKGKELRTTATFIVTTRTGSKQFHLVAKHYAPPAQLAKLRRIASADDSVVIVTLLADLRANVSLFWRLERLRQAATLHFNEGAGLDLLILAAAEKGARSRLEVREALHQLDAQLLDARLASLHVAGLLRLDLTTENFGVSVAVRGAP